MGIDNKVAQFLARFYPRLSADRLRLELKILYQLFPSFKIELLSIGKILVRGLVANGNDTRYVFIALPHSYPFRMPKLYMRPRPLHHMFSDGSVCLHMSWGQRNTLAQLVVKAAELIGHER